MTLEALTTLYVQRLQKLYEETEAKEIIKLVFVDNLNLSINKYHLLKQRLVTIEEINNLEPLIIELENGKPLQQVHGYEYFCGLKFSINKHVLIPRPETEELVQIISKEIVAKNYASVIDFGTGSGCIPISLQHQFPNLQVEGVDISVEALLIAKQNNALVHNKVVFNHFDILQNVPLWNKTADVFISNPPYIPTSESKNMSALVVENEPHIALFTPNEDPNIFYKKIAALAKQFLNTNGMLAFEIHYDSGNAVKKICEEIGLQKVKVIKSFFGHERFVIAYK